MGTRQNYLKELVAGTWGTYIHAKPTPSDIVSSKYFDFVINTYSELGGISTNIPIRYGPWDISSKKFIVELDEERHFNRYRYATLKSKFYENSDCFSKNDYLKDCREKESICLRVAAWGKNWKNDSTERQFEKSNDLGNLTGNGSSRWKQRALYDFVKDVSGRIMEIPIYRISIYDSFNGNSINNLLEKNQDKLLLKYLEARLGV